jgi:hypothetical protein
MAKNEQSIQNSVRIQSTAVLAGSSSNWGRGIDRRAPVSSRSCREFAGVRIEFGPPGSSSLARRSATCSAGQAGPPMLNVPTREQQVGWAIVGLGKLTLEQILPAFGVCKSSYPAALVSGHPEKARQVAGTYGIDAQAIYGYEDFERIKDNGRIDVVYIVLPNSMHAEYTIRALQSGKHVLCEKPMAASLAECEAMIDASRKARGSSASPIVCTMNR